MKRNLENARIELKRNATLLASKIVAQEAYDTAQAQVRQLEAAVKVGPGGSGQRQGATGLYDDHRADRWPHRITGG